MRKIFSFFLLMILPVLFCACSAGGGESTAPEKIDKFTPNDSYTVEKTEVRTSVKERKNRPVEFERSSSFDDLIFYGNEPKAYLKEGAEWR
jgi:hypothetical protein